MTIKQHKTAKTTMHKGYDIYRAVIKDPESK